MTAVLPDVRRWTRRAALVATAAGVVLAATATSAVAATTTDGFNPDPNRIFDSRITLNDRPAGPASGIVKAQLPESVAEGGTALLSVTVVTPAKAGYITVYSDGATKPKTSDANFVPGNTVARAVLVQNAPESNGVIDLDIDPNAGPITLVVDVVGSFPAATYTSLPTAQRIYDSREDGEAPGPVDEGSYEVALPLGGDNGVPDDAQAVAVNVTQADSTGTGYVSILSAAATEEPTTSSVNYDAGTVNNNLVWVKPTDGKIYFAVVGAPTNVIIDLKGYTLSSSVTAQAPERTLDTRTAENGGLVGPKATVPIPLTDNAPQGASFALLNVTSTEATAAGWIASYEAAEGQMQTSNLNFVPGPNVAGFVLAPIVDGKAQVYVGAGTTKLVADVEGYVVNATG